MKISKEHIYTADIVRHFWNVPTPKGIWYNWGTEPRDTHQGLWDVNDKIYINGVVSNVDFDFTKFYLLEVCERVDKKQTLVYYLCTGYHVLDHNSWHRWLFDGRSESFGDRAPDFDQRAALHLFIDWACEIDHG